MCLLGVALHNEGPLPPCTSSVSTWSGPCEVHQAQPLPKSCFVRHLEDVSAYEGER